MKMFAASSLNPRSVTRLNFKASSDRETALMLTHYNSYGVI
jgi:hypothetical protein